MFTDLNLIYSEKSTKIWRNFQNFLWHYLVISKIWIFCQNLVAFSEYMNFKRQRCNIFFGQNVKIPAPGTTFIPMYDYANYNSALCTLCRLSSRPQVLPGWNQDKSGLQWMVKFFFPSLSLTLKLLTTKLWQSPNDFMSI